MSLQRIKINGAYPGATEVTYFNLDHTYTVLKRLSYTLSNGADAFR